MSLRGKRSAHSFHLLNMTKDRRVGLRDGGLLANISNGALYLLAFRGCSEMYVLRPNQIRY